MTDRRHLAQLNVGRLVAPVGDPRVAAFVDALDAVNAIADRSPGFVWRLQDASGDATSFRLPGDGRTLVNMSVWEDGDALRHYVFNTIHRRFYERRREWFEVMAEHHVVMWWVEPGHVPTLEEAGERLERLRRDGPSRHAFGWGELPDAEAWLERACA
ncbi:MAG: DUF3291 domain-containing protein [Caulobacterales bacterium]|nr:DUF3291 domain-containing protein [Caulobacterales bacterium]